MAACLAFILMGRGGVVGRASMQINMEAAFAIVKSVEMALCKVSVSDLTSKSVKEGNRWGISCIRRFFSEKGVYYSLM